jgi:hypothetical protein
VRLLARCRRTYFRRLPAMDFRSPRRISGLWCNTARNYREPLHGSSHKSPGQLLPNLRYEGQRNCGDRSVCGCRQEIWDNYPDTAPTTGNEAITITLAQFRNDQKRWTVTGTDSALAGQLTVKWIHLVNGVSAATTLGTATVTVTGAWNFDTRGVASKLIPQQGDPVTVTGPSGATKSANVSVIK